MFCNSFEELPRDIDVLYHTRIQSERFEGDFGKEKFIINKQVLETFTDKAMVLHPLPRMEEISTDIDDDPRALYFEQVKNGMYITNPIWKAIFSSLIINAGIMTVRGNLDKSSGTSSISDNWMFRIFFAHIGIWLNILIKKFNFNMIYNWFFF